MAHRYLKMTSDGFPSEVSYDSRKSSHELFIMLTIMNVLGDKPFGNMKKGSHDNV